MMLELNDHEIAYELTKGSGTCVVFCAGFNSTMQGTKAKELKAFCIDKGLPFIRFDYSGHGESTGEFAEGCISSWLADTLAIIDRVAIGDVILVGSSMGGWLALLAALKRPQRVRGLLLIACAADMTKAYPQRLAGLPPQLDDKLRLFYLLANQYDEQEPYSIYQKLIDDGASHFLLDGPIELDIPVRLIHGIEDDVIEWQRSEQVMNCLTSKNVNFLSIKSGDHRLSSPEDIHAIRGVLLNLLSA